jgi:hypothetical protein
MVKKHDNTENIYYETWYLIIQTQVNTFSTDIELSTLNHLVSTLNWSTMIKVQMSPEKRKYSNISILTLLFKCEVFC